MKYKLILWDFDGTLADTLQAALEIYNQLAADRGYQRIDDPHAVRDMGMKTFLKSHGVPLYKVPLLFAAFLKELKRRSADIELNSGIADVVVKLADADIRQCVISSNDTQTIRDCLRRLQLDHCFDDICGTSRLFGKESRIRSIMQSLNVSRGEVLYVGDEIRDIDAARAAEVDVVAVGWGLNSEQALRLHRPTWFVEEPAQLFDVVNGSENFSASDAVDSRPNVS